MLLVIVLQKWTLHLQLVQFDKQPENLCMQGQVENAEVRKPKYGNGSMETEVRKWEEKPPLDV